MRRRHRAWRFTAAVLTSIVLIGGTASTQSVSAPDLKGAYLFRFAQFVDWPDHVLEQGAPLTLCVVNDAAVADALEQTIRGRSVGSHALTLKRVNAGDPLPTCHVLYLAASDPKRQADLIQTLGNKFVLTVSDASRFARAGGMVELFIENGGMRFAVNVDALQRARIVLSSRVLVLAKIVKDGDAR